MAAWSDGRLVVLLQSLVTQNRFYALVDPARGWKDASAIPAFPDDLPLGIAYPCMEDALNDFAVIRTTFETLDVFPNDEELRQEMMAIIDDARGRLRGRLRELRDRIRSGQAHFLGIDLEDLKASVIRLMQQGMICKTLDHRMKLDVFEAVAETEAAMAGRLRPEPIYRYEPLPQHSLDQIRPLPPREFLARLFEDVLDAMDDDANYTNKYPFDRNVFRKFAAVMFVYYTATDAEG